MSKAIRRIGPAIVVAAVVGGYVLAGGSTAGAAKPLARATLTTAGAEPVVLGTVVFKGTGHYANRVEVQLELPAGAPGLGAYHGFHIHTTGLCSPGFGSAGPHWSTVEGAAHGNHTGDMPSVLVGLDGTAYAEFETARFDVNDLFDTDGSAVILHADPDNFGNMPRGTGQYADPDGFYASSTSKTGDAGARYGCGVVQSLL